MVMVLFIKDLDDYFTINAKSNVFLMIYIGNYERFSVWRKSCAKDRHEKFLTTSRKYTINHGKYTKLFDIPTLLSKNNIKNRHFL